MTISDYIAKASDTPSMVIDSSWGQGQTTFGGISAALLLARIEQQTPEQHHLRSVSVHFCGPSVTGEPLQLNEQPLRVGKSISHFQAQASQNDKIVTSISACYGSLRDSDIHVAHEPVVADSLNAGQAMPYIAGLTPEFVQHVEMVYLEGQFPFSNSPHNLIRGRMRFKNCAQALGNAHLLALIDSWPPVPLQKMAKPGPCATVTWNVEMISPLALIEPIAGDEWLYYTADIRQARDGYGHTEARISRADGTVLVLSRQLVAVYDKR